MFFFFFFARGEKLSLDTWPVKMAGASLTTYNSELVKALEDLREQREEMNRSILRDEEEKARIQKARSQHPSFAEWQQQRSSGGAAATAAICMKRCCLLHCMARARGCAPPAALCPPAATLPLFLAHPTPPAAARRS